jgi:uncharacterized heparinase superfamily protein
VPITFVEDYNRPAFHSAAAFLREAGYEIKSPSELVTPEALLHGWDWARCMRSALTLMVQCDAVALLSGWMCSRGAQIEFDLAARLEIPTGTVAQWVKRAAIARTAAAIARTAPTIYPEGEE